MRAKMLTMRRLVAGVLCLLLGGAAFGQPPTAGTPAELEQRSRAHYKLGTVHLDMKEYDDAIREFQIGYEYKNVPLFLYNIGRVAALADHRTMAVEYYQKYLEAKPNAPERAEVLQRIRDLQHSLAAKPEKLPVETPAPPVEKPAEQAESVTPPPPQDTPVVAPTEPNAVVLDAPPPEKKSHKAAIALGVVGGIVVVGGAIVLGVLLTRDSGPANWGTLNVGNGAH